MVGAKVGRALAGVTVVAAITAAIALAFATLDPPPLKAKTRTQRVPAPVVAAPASQIILQEAAAPPPPGTSEFAPPKPATAAAPAGPAPASVLPPDLSALTPDEARARANRGDVPAMEELGRRLIQGTGVPKDPQAGAGWLLRAAEQGSAQSAFNVGVMYERGFVVERDSSKAVFWYRKAADAGLAVARHNLALLLRDGKGAPRDVKASIGLLKAAAQQGMAASMFTLGDIYDRGDASQRDPVEALAWFAVAAEFEHQVNNGTETTLSRTADQRAQALQRTLTPEELARAQDRAQGEFRIIVASLSPPPPAAPPAESKPPAQPPAEETVAAPAPAPAPADTGLVAWPASTLEQVRAVQQMLFDLKLSREKPDGSLGPKTRAVIRDFQNSAGLKPTGEVSKDLYLALRIARTRSDVVANSPLPSPASTAEAPKDEPKQEARQEPRQAAAVELPSADAPAPPPGPADIVALNLPRLDAPKFEPPTMEPPRIDPPKPPMPPIDTAKPQPVKVEVTPPPAGPAAQAAAWPGNRIDQVKAIQALLREMKIYNSAVDGIASVGTRNAIRDYERMAGLKESGEPSKAVFDSLNEMRALMGGKR